MVVSACHRIGILKRRVIILVLASDCDFWYQSSNNVLYCWVSHGARQSDGVKGGAFCAALDTSASSTDTLLGACLQIMIVTIFMISALIVLERFGIPLLGILSAVVQIMLGVSAWHRIGILKGRLISMVLAYDCDKSFCESDSVCFVSGGAFCNEKPDSVLGALAMAANVVANGKAWYYGACLQIMIVTGYILGLRVELIIPIVEVVSDG